jgi:hypothetical protein
MIGIIALTAVLSFAAGPTKQSPQDAAIVFYRVRTPEPTKRQSGIRRIFDRPTQADPDQNPTIYQMTAGGATRLATIAKGEFFELHVRPGHYGFSWTSGPARGETTIVSVNAGQRAFVQVQFRSISEVAAEIATIDLKDLRPTNAVRVYDAAVRTAADPIAAQPPTPPPARSDDQPPPQPPSIEQAATLPPPQQEIVVRKDLHSKTLGWIRQTYLNQSIIIRGSVERGTLVDWNVARKTVNGYRLDATSIAARYHGQTAKVIAIQVAGAATAADDVVDPAFELVAQFADGTLALTATRLEFLADRTKLASEQKLREAEMAKNLPLIVGKRLYATGLSTLYEPDTTIEDITSSREILKRLSPTRIPLMEPLPILGGKYLPAQDGVLIRLRLPTGSEAVSFTSGSLLDATYPDVPFIEKIAGHLLAGIPRELSPNEVEAIKQGDLVKGMSSAAVLFMFGPPDSESNWGAGGKQRIYLKQISVHFDNKNKVVDWQVLGSK